MKAPMVKGYTELIGEIIFYIGTTESDYFNKNI